MISLLLATLAGAASPDCHAVLDATVLLPEGERTGVDVVWRDGRIVALAPDADPTGCVVHPGRWVTPPLVATATSTGLAEVELEHATRDDAGHGDPVRASFAVGLAFDPRSAVVPVTRLGGIGTAVLVPGPALVAGQAAVVSLRTAAQHEVLLASDAAVVVHPGALGSLGEGLARLGELVEDARRVAAGKDPWSEVERVSASRVDLLALGPVVRGERALWVEADKASDLEALLAFAERARVKLIVRGGAEAWLVAEALAAADVPVFVDPYVVGAGGFDQLRGRADNAKRLAEAGVRVGFLAPETHNARALRFVAGNAVRAGMAHADALAAVTSVPASTFGVGGRGELRVGAPAHLAVWSDDPLDTMGRLVLLVLDGETQTLTSRQTALVDAWRTLPRHPLPGPPAGAVTP